MSNINTVNSNEKSFLQKFKYFFNRNKSPDHIPIQHETLLLRKFMFESLSKVRFPNYSNLTKSEINLYYVQTLVNIFIFFTAET